MKVIIECHPDESIWCAKEFIRDMKGMTRKEQDAEMIYLFQEDIPALLEGAVWKIVRDKD